MLVQQCRADRQNACRCSTDCNNWLCRNQHNNLFRFRLHDSQGVQALQTKSYYDCCCIWPLAVLYAASTTTGDDSILPAHQPSKQSLSFILSCLFIQSCQVSFHHAFSFILYTCGSQPCIYSPRMPAKNSNSKCQEVNKKRRWHAAVAMSWRCSCMVTAEAVTSRRLSSSSLKMACA